MCDVRRVQVFGCLAGAAIAVTLGLAAPARAEPAESAESATEEPAPEAASPVAPAPAPRSSEAIERVRRQVLDARYQDELPRYRSDAGSGSGAAGRPRRAAGQLDDLERERRMLDTRARDDAGGSSLVTVVMWGLVIVVLVLIASWLVSELSRYGGDAELADEVDRGGPSQAARAAIIERPLGDADELARRGEFAEAIHTLLLRTLQELARSAAVRVAPATTSREVLARVPLLADARDALAGLITAVEITHFGDEPANAADYERCRQQFHVFATAFRGGGPARTAVLVGTGTVAS